MNRFSKYLKFFSILSVLGLILIFFISCTSRTSDDELNPITTFGVSSQITNGQGAVGRLGIPSPASGKIETIEKVALENGELILKEKAGTCDKKLEFSLWITLAKEEHKNDPNSIAEGDPDVFWEATTKLQTDFKYSLEEAINLKAAVDALAPVLEGDYSVLLKIRLVCEEKLVKVNGELRIKRVVFTLKVLEPLIGPNGKTLVEFELTGDNLGSALKPIILDFSSDPEIINKGQDTTLLWSIAGANKLELDNNLGIVTNETEKQIQPTETTNYTIKASNEQGSVEKQTKVTVLPVNTALKIAEQINNGTGFTGGTNIPRIGEGSINGVEGVNFKNGELQLENASEGDKKLEFKMWVEPTKAEHKNNPNSIAKDTPDISWNITTKLKEGLIYSLEDIVNFQAVNGALDPITQGNYSALLKVEVLDDNGVIKSNGKLKIEQLALELLAPNLTMPKDTNESTVLGGEKGEQTVPIIASFIANPSIINEGQKTILTWSVSGAESLTIDKDVGDVTNLAEKELAPRETTTYTLTASNKVGSNQMQTTVTKNEAPIAGIGNLPAAITVGDIVKLDGSKSTDPEGNPLSFNWDFISKPTGSNATWDDATSPTPSFTADVIGDFEVRLVVTDSNKASSTDTLTLTVNKANTPPVANGGGNQSVSTGNVVTLDGTTSSDADGDVLTFIWTIESKPTGSNSTLNNANTDTANFTPDVIGDYQIKLTVNDGQGGTNSSIVTITVTINTPPIADAGNNRTVNVGDLVNLNGSNSKDLDNDPISFNWSFTAFPANSNTFLNNSNTVTPNFIADSAGSYQISLIVTDDKGASSSVDTVTIIAVAPNNSPTANAGGNQSVSVGDLVNLNGNNSSDPDGDPLIFNWSFTSIPTGSAATLSDTNSATPNFTADVAGDYQVSLTVMDSKGAISADSIIITASAGPTNTPPTANAGSDQNVTVGDAVNLDGSGSSDLEGDPITFSWTFTSKPTSSSATLNNPTTKTPNFTADVGGNYIINLVVTDDKGASSAVDSVTITVNTPPVANAGNNQAVAVSSTVNLDGRSSNDPDGDALTYSWSFSSKPVGSSATLTNPTTVNPSFIADVAGSYIVSLVVTDNKGASNTDTVTITATVNNPPVADAGGNQSASFGDTITLDGTGSSDPDGDPLIFSWAFVSKPAVSIATLSGANTNTASFVGDVNGSYEIRLTVTDDKGVIDIDTATITVGIFGWDAGGDGVSWDDPLNWTADTLPSVDSTVAINSGDTITLNSTVTIAGLQLLGGTLNGNGQLTVTDNAIWTTGTLAGEGKLVLQGITEISGGNSKYIEGSRIIENSGTVTWKDGSISKLVDLTGIPQFNNLAGAVFNVNSTGCFCVVSTGKQLIFNNDGTINVNVHEQSEASWQNIILNNNSSNTVNVINGTFILGNGTHAGVFNVASEATLEFSPSEDLTLTSTSSIKGAGTVYIITSGNKIDLGNSIFPTYTILAGARTFNNNVTINSPATFSNLHFSFSSLKVIENINIVDTFTWSNSTLEITSTGNVIVGNSGMGTLNWINNNDGSQNNILKGSGKLILNGTTNLESFVILEDSVTIDNQGTLFLKHSFIRSSNTTTINNNGVVDLQVDVNFSNNGFTFNNSGTLMKTLTTGKYVWDDVIFNNANTGTVDIQTGTLEVGGGDISGNLNVESGATFQINPASASISTSNLKGVSVTGAGTLEFSDGSDYTTGGVVNISNSTLPNNIKINGHVTVNFNSALSIGNLELASSLSGLSVSKELTITDKFIWTGGGNIVGKFILASGSNTEISGSSGWGTSKGLSGVIDNSGTITWLNDSNNILNGDTVFNNLSGGVFDVQNDASFSVSGSLTFNNAGALKKTIATGTSDWSGVCYVDKGGTLDIQTGKITFGTCPATP